MNRFHIPLAVCLAALTVLIWAATVAAGPGAGTPKTVVKQPKHDFGNVYAGEKITHTFFIENTGDAPLVLKSVRTG